MFAPIDGEKRINTSITTRRLNSDGDGSATLCEVLISAATMSRLVPALKRVCEIADFSEHCAARDDRAVSLVLELLAALEDA